MISGEFPLQENSFFIEGERFVIKGGRVFERGEKLRKRIKCVEVPHNRTYLFSPLFEVLRIAM